MAICRARVVTGRFSLAQCPHVAPEVPLARLELSQTLTRLRPLPAAGIPNQSYFDPPEAFSPPFSPL
jgi:hypothetical protein